MRNRLGSFRADPPGRSRHELGEDASVLSERRRLTSAALPGGARCAGAEAAAPLAGSMPSGQLRGDREVERELRDDGGFRELSG
jgi:hypothetical protein